ncbi:restriction endonuclease subunit S [Candidatus Sumerlaeota bacterium]|nr:restriction endonuclease subunit S [Candidatus Sumerlaeota bacterium]
MIELRNVAHYVTDRIGVTKLKVEEYITTDNMVANRGGIKECESLPRASTVTRYDFGDILVSNIRPYFKKIWYSNRASGCSNDVLVFRKNDDSWDTKFLYYVLSQDAFFDFMMSGANGTKMPRGNKKAILDFSVPDFDLEKQRRIADILSTYDNLIENNQKQIKLLEEAAQRLYKEWFVDLRFPGHEHVKVIDGVPEGWRKATVSDFATVVERGITPSYSDSGKYLVINQKCIRQSIMDISLARRQTKKYVEELNIEESDTVICSTGSGTLGRVGQVFGEYANTTFDSHVTLVRSIEYKNFLYHSIKNQESYLMGMGRGSTNQQELYRDVIERASIGIPNEIILSRFEMMAIKLHERITSLSSQNSLLLEARDRLLPKLMSGEIEV